jgi:hypothetical protein
MNRVAVLALAVCLLWPTVAYAEDGGGLARPVGGFGTRETVVIDEGPPKGVIGFGVQCIGTLTHGDTTLRQVEYSGMDDAEYAKDAAREEAWSRDNCKWQLEQGMAGWFKWQRGVDIDVSRIKVTYKDV